MPSVGCRGGSTLESVRDTCADQGVASVSEVTSRSRAVESLLTIEEVADRLNVGVRFVRRLVAERRIVFHKVGRYVRFHPADVEALIEAGRVEDSARRGSARWSPTGGQRAEEVGMARACIRIYRPTAIGPLAGPLSRWCGRGESPGCSFKTKTDASAFLATIETDLLRGDWNDPRPTACRCAWWAEQWFETTAHLKPKTRVEYASNLRNHVLPFFGDKPVGAIDALGVRQFVSTLRVDGLEHGTVKKAKAVLSMVLGSAAEAGARSRPTRAPTSGSVGPLDVRWCS